MQISTHSLEADALIGRYFDSCIQNDEVIDSFEQAISDNWNQPTYRKAWTLMEYHYFIARRIYELSKLDQNRAEQLRGFVKKIAELHWKMIVPNRWGDDEFGNIASEAAMHRKEVANLADRTVDPNSWWGRTFNA